MTEQEALRRRIAAVDFAAWELHLFLDTHPNDADAAKKLQAYRERGEALRADYEEKFGPLGENMNETSRWAWICQPWPWETEVQDDVCV